MSQSSSSSWSLVCLALLLNYAKHGVRFRTIAIATTTTYIQQIAVAVVDMYAINGPRTYAANLENKFYVANPWLANISARTRATCCVGILIFHMLRFSASQTICECRSKEKYLILNFQQTFGSVLAAVFHGCTKNPSHCVQSYACGFHCNSNMFNNKPKPW